MTIRDLIRWERPFGVPVQYSERFTRSLETLQDEMNRLFDHLYNGAEVHMTDWDQKLPTSPNINMFEDEQSVKIEAELAGISPEQVSVEVTDNQICIKGEKKEEKSEQDKNFTRREISYGSFYRALPLPGTVDAKKAEATFKNGILSVTFPKNASALQKPTKLQIKKAA